MQISPSTGKALDISGAFLFALAFVACLFVGWYILALACAAASGAFFTSWRVWNAPDDVEVRFNQTWTVILAAFAALLFSAAILSLVLA